VHCIANIINIISETQKGFLKGRYIGECTRLVYDLIDKLEEDDIPGLLLLIDFEEAFDTVEWSFIEKTCGLIEILHTVVKSLLLRL
jgi:hypothetical protein